MPGPIVHLQNVIGLPPYLRELGGDRGRSLADVLDADPCSPYTGFGAQGPDFLVFSLKEYGTPLDELVNFMFGVYDALEPFIDFYEQTVQPVENAIDDAVQAVDQAAFNGLIGDIGATATPWRDGGETMGQRLLPTAVVGSYSAPEWLERMKTDYFQRRISSDTLDQIHDVAIKAAIKDQELAGIDVVGEAADGESAITTIDALRPELVFLDVQMPGLLGTDVLRRLERPPFVVFTTAYS